MLLSPLHFDRVYRPKLEAGFAKPVAANPSRISRSTCSSRWFPATI